MTRKEWQWGVLQFPMLSKTFTMLLDQQRETYILSIWYPKHCKKRVQFCKLREIPLPIGGTVVILCNIHLGEIPLPFHGIAVILLKYSFGEIPSIFTVLLWSSLEAIVTAIPCGWCWDQFKMNCRGGSQHYYENGNGISPKEYFRRITAIPWNGKGISPVWMFPEHHNSTINWKWDLSDNKLICGF